MSGNQVNNGKSPLSVFGGCFRRKFADSDNFEDLFNSNQDNTDLNSCLKEEVHCQSMPNVNEEEKEKMIKEITILENRNQELEEAYKNIELVKIELNRQRGLLKAELEIKDKEIEDLKCSQLEFALKFNECQVLKEEAEKELKANRIEEEITKNDFETKVYQFQLEYESKDRKIKNLELELIEKNLQKSIEKKLLEDNFKNLLLDMENEHKQHIMMLEEENAEKNAEIKDLLKKFAESAGHTNARQKIQHVSRLTDDLSKAREDIESLKKEVFRLKKKYEPAVSKLKYTSPSSSASSSSSSSYNK